MAFCAKCGASLVQGVAFCGSCGTPVGAAAAGSAPASAATTGIDSNLAGLLAYVAGIITGVIFLVIEPYKNDKFVRFHAFQSIFLNVAWIGVWIVFSIVGSILAAATGGWLAFVMLPVSLLLVLAFLAIWVFLMYKAYNKERYMIPFIGPLAAKQAG